jgi:hypothetical protein
VGSPGLGKSEVRHYLAQLDQKDCVQQFGIGQTVQLDDFPYVHFMRRVSDESVARGHEGIFFLSPVLPFREPREWGVLTQLLNEDYQDLLDHKVIQPKSAALWLFDRIDAARKKVGAQPAFKNVSKKLKKELAAAVEPEAKKLLAEKVAEIKKGADLTNKTVIMECARGGADGSPMPLPAPFGYQYTLSQLSPAILKDVVIFYIWGTPEESRRKNLARANPNDPGSNLNHCVPQAVMYADYGCDDMRWLEQQSDKSHTVRVQAHGSTWYLPVGIFDNRTDLTTFVRDDMKCWKRRDVNALHTALKETFSHLQA